MRIQFFGVCMYVSYIIANIDINLLTYQMFMLVIQLHQFTLKEHVEILSIVLRVTLCDENIAGRLYRAFFTENYCHWKPVKTWSNARTQRGETHEEIRLLAIVTDAISLDQFACGNFARRDARSRGRKHIDSDNGDVWNARFHHSSRDAQHPIDNMGAMSEFTKLQRAETGIIPPRLWIFNTSRGACCYALVKRGST